MNLIRLVPVLMVLFVLGACGGGGGSSSVPETTSTEPEMPTEPEGPTKEEMAAEEARVMGLTEAIADPDGDGKLPEPLDNELTKRRPTGTFAFGIGGQTTVTTGTMVDILDKNDVNIRNANEFQKIDSSRIDMSGSEFSVSVHERTTTTGKTDTITVYTNVEAAKAVPFNTIYATGTTHNGITTGDAAAADPGETTYRVLAFEANTDITSGGDNAITGSRFPSGATGGDTVTRELDASSMFSGTFRGVPGSYACGGAACTVTQSAADGVQVTAGELTFTPTKTIDDTQDAHAIAGAMPDTDYLSFGYWVQTMAMGSDTKYGVGAFSGGSMPFDDDEDRTNTNQAIADLHGTATYEGSATGLYAKKALSVVDGEVVGTPAYAGQFSADVSLTAHFGNETPTNTAIKVDHISANEVFTISGTMDNFQNANGDLISTNWDLLLNRAPFGTADVRSHTFEGTTGTGNSMGQWRGTLYGPTVDDAEDTYPAGTSGEFTGHFTDGHVIGAFGTTIDE